MTAPISPLNRAAAGLAVVSAFAGIAVAVGLTVIGGALWPGYSHLSQFISELGAHGAPNGWEVSWLGFLPTGVLLTLFPAFARMALPKSTGATLGFIGIALYAMGYTMSAFFPCEAGCRPETLTTSQMMHNLFGLAGYVLAPVALGLLAGASKKWPRAGLMPVVGWVTMAAALAGLITLSPASPWVGLSQRVLEGAVLLWIGACAVYLSRAR